MHWIFLFKKETESSLYECNQETPKEAGHYTDVPRVLLPFYVKLPSNWLLFFSFLKYKDIVLQPLISNVLKTEVLIMLLFFSGITTFKGLKN